MADWSNIPDGVMDIIVKQLNCIEDFTRFGSVCNSWRSVATIEQSQPQPRSFSPLLMVHFEEGDEYLLGFDIAKNKSFCIELPEAKRARCFGSQYGWLITSDTDLKIHLLHPFSRTRIPLPSQTTFQRSTSFRYPPHMRVNSVSRFILSSNPSFGDHQEWVVMAIHSSFCHIAFARAGDQAWSSIEISTRGAQDLIFFSGQFYVVDDRGTLSLCDINTHPPKLVDIAPRNEYVEPTQKFYLVEILGTLHLVARVFVYVEPEDPDSFYNEAPWYEAETEAPDSFQNKTSCFVVYKFDFHTRHWNPIESLEGHALFLGNNTSFAIPTSDYPGLKGHRIYYTDDHNDYYGKGYSEDIGVFDYEEFMKKEAFPPLCDFPRTRASSCFLLPTLC